jgi:hypothetical protein
MLLIRSPHPASAAAPLAHLFPVNDRRLVRQTVDIRRAVDAVHGLSNGPAQRHAPVMPDPTPPIQVNRAPVLTLWAAVVAERLGHPPETALTLGRAVAGSSARIKAWRLGIADEGQQAEERNTEATGLKPRAETIRLLGRDIPVLVKIRLDTGESIQSRGVHYDANAISPSLFAGRKPG